MSDVIGALTARVRVERPVRTDDNLGGATITWSDEGDVWSFVESIGASAAERHDTEASTTILRVTIRRRTIRAGWRLVWGARVLRVTGVRDDGGDRIQVLCEEETL